MHTTLAGRELFASLNTMIIDFLKSLPNLVNENGQRAFIYDAGLDAALQEQIRFSLPVAEFAPFLVTTLTTYGELRDGRNALQAVLETSKQYVGRDRQIACEHLIQELSNYTSRERVGNGRLQTKTLTEEQAMPAAPEKPLSGVQISGGINISNINGRVTFGVVGGSHQSNNIAADIIIGDTITGAKTVREVASSVLTTITHDFKQDADKVTFLEQTRPWRFGKSLLVST